ncbi:response regulator [Halorarius litoreus]|uniref:response regulator n=1 Tax=Halorarius litoreus TaxID=2962676 RepID=UPI0020CF26F2|nr:response regulator [Halorarius litoreus]
MARPRRILHLDDQPELLELVEAQLARGDDALEFEQATTVTEALELLETADPPFECVVSDYKMPGRNGLEFLMAVRERRPDIPFLLYTGERGSEVIGEGIAAGLTDFVRKRRGPEHYSLLSSRIARSVDRYRAEQDREAIRGALEQSREGICVLDTDGRIKYANRAFRELYGYDETDLVGTGWEQLHPPAEAEFLLAEVLPSLESDGEWTGESVGKRADDSRFRESTILGQLPAGEIAVVVTELREVTSGDGNETAATDNATTPQPEDQSSSGELD